MNEKQKELAEAVIEEIIKPVFPANMLKDTRFLVNPTGRFEIGGPHGDAGLTGRKIIVDTYGGAAPHGGGAFSGKDPSKVDRSAAYAARYVAKNIVAAGIARQCQVQVAYAIGVARPMNVTVYTEGTGKISDEQIAELVQRALRPASEGHRAHARPAAPHLPQDGRVRPLRPRRARVHVGAHGQGGSAARCHRRQVVRALIVAAALCVAGCATQSNTPQSPPPGALPTDTHRVLPPPSPPSRSTSTTRRMARRSPLRAAASSR